MPPVKLPPPATRPYLGEGLTLGVWRLESPMSGGETGQWYRASHARAEGQQAAALVMHRNELSAELLLRFADHADELGKIQHARIAVATDSGVTPLGQPYLVLGAMQGEPILEAAEAFNLRERLDLIVQLCELLRHLHQHGWLLAEVDPEMIWVDEQGQVSLMGLGLASIPDPDGPFERGRSPVGLPAFVSPEQRGGHPASLAAEVYGLGCLLYALVDGRLPNEMGSGVADASPAARWRELKLKERMSLDALLRKAASPLVQRRQPCAEVLADDVRAWLSGGNHSAMSFTPMPEVAGAVIEKVAAEKPKRRRWSFLAVAALLVLGGAALERAGGLGAVAHAIELKR
ncbi:serine/threonine protein kinase [Burkholderiaceae bacterium UC74_6]